MAAKSKQPEKLKVMRWYDTIRDACDDLEIEEDRNALIDAVVAASEYYVEATADSNQHLLIVGKLEQLITENTGLAFFYNGIHTDALQVRKYLEMILEGYEAKKYMWFQTHPDAKAEFGGKLTATDLRNYIKAEDIVLVLNDCIRLITNRQHMMENVRDGFITRGFNLKTIADMRIAKLEEVWVDGTRETENT